MTETNASIHVLADEKLGGIKREYVEVDRKAIEGESIVIVGKKFPEDVYNNGDILTVDRDFHSEMTFVESDEAISAEYNCSGLIYHEEYRVLEPTDIVHIDGQRYELTERKAEVGEKVMYVDESGESYGIVTEVLAVGAGVVDVAEYEEPSGAIIVGFSHDRYRVLVPVEATEDEPQPADPIDVIASLAQEVAELKRKVSDLETVVESHELINSRHNCEIDTLHKDNRTLGEELARLASEVGKETESSAKALAEAFVALRRAGL
ncbi:hypothetical protein RY279_06535 [Bacillus velezensis]|uniref:hypothetical protein n=1 Tax=Bacillus velezensis TaxID=492670 RepID=UPI001C64BAB4|nr:hypothetical protein [Bacillus velezensis]MBW7977978.1 hypothetical protein [Bacillus velezensis]